MIALRLRYEVDGPEVSVTPFCEVCRRVFLPSASMVGSQADWLMKQIEAARIAPDAPPEAYDRLYE